MYVIDASVVVKWFVPEVYSDKATQLLAEFVDEKLELTAPDLVVAEVGQTLWKLSVKIGLISIVDATNSYDSLLALELPTEPSVAIAKDALSFATRENHSVYDSLYIALAQQHGCDMITADEKLANKLSSKFPFIRWLGTL